MNNLFLKKELYFPPIENATKEGIVAIGGYLTTERLLLAYKSGIFPWFSDEDPIIWWSPDPRFVLFPDKIIISKSMKKILKKEIFKITIDTAFSDVIKMCREVRLKKEGTWITEDMISSYTKLHELGFAHSAEAWLDGKLAGGLYGLSLGSCFFGESMFSSIDNASKSAFITLVEKLKAKNFTLIDCQVYTKHLESLGAENISRNEFLHLLEDGLKKETLTGSWNNI
jgi:leucyl/phenylalanyl-tRNA---protein transferase